VSRQAMFSGSVPDAASKGHTCILNGRLPQTHPQQFSSRRDYVSEYDYPASIDRFPKLSGAIPRDVALDAHLSGRS
jgi:hypothetical protein